MFVPYLEVPLIASGDLTEQDKRNKLLTEAVSLSGNLFHLSIFLRQPLF